MPDACTQTHSAAPPAYNDAVPAVAIESVERLKRFLIYSLKRDYNAEVMGTLSFSENSQWHDVGSNPALSASRDRIKFDNRLNDFIETPCKLSGISSRQVWVYVLAQGKNYFLDTKFRTYVRERHQQSPQDWVNKLQADRKLVAKITNDENVRHTLHKAINREVGEWFVKLDSEQEWQLTPKGESQWSWRRSWM